MQEILAYIEQDRYLSLRRAVNYLCLSERKIRQMLREIPHFRIGSKLLFRKSELDRWMEQHREDTEELDIRAIAEKALERFNGNR